MSGKTDKCSEKCPDIISKVGELARGGDEGKPEESQPQHLLDYQFSSLVAEVAVSLVTVLLPNELNLSVSGRQNCFLLSLWLHNDETATCFSCSHD